MLYQRVKGALSEAVHLDLSGLGIGKFILAYFKFDRRFCFCFIAKFYAMLMIHSLNTLLLLVEDGWLIFLFWLFCIEH